MAKSGGLRLESSRVLIDPWGAVLIEDYERLIENFGLHPFTDRLLNSLPEPNKLMRRKIVFAHRDLNKIIHAIKQKKRFYALSGIMPSAEKIHLGNKMVVENMAYFQKNGAETFMLIADLESAATRGVSIEEAKERALTFHIPAYIALGLDSKKTTFYFQSENSKIVNLAYMFSKRVNENMFRAVYGSLDPGRIFASLTQAGDMLFPQLENSMIGIVPVGIDQDPHIRLARDLANRTKSLFRFTPPASIYHKFTPSLDGGFKMSKSKPASYLEIPMATNESTRRLKNALTGGRKTEEEQKRLGGVPEKCVIFELEKQHFIEDDARLDQIYRECVSGQLLCGEHKEKVCDFFTRYMTEFDKRFERAKNQSLDIREF